MANKKTPPQSRGCFRVSSGTAFDASRGIATPRPATEATGGLRYRSTSVLTCLPGGGFFLLLQQVNTFQ